jgi:hypothetical protein
VPGVVIVGVLETLELPFQIIICTPPEIDVITTSALYALLATVAA